MSLHPSGRKKAIQVYSVVMYLVCKISLYSNFIVFHWILEEALETSTQPQL